MKSPQGTGPGRAQAQPAAKRLILSILFILIKKTHL